MKPIFTFAATAALGAMLSTPAFATDFWLGGVDPVIQRTSHKGSMKDYLELLSDPKAWSASALKVSVFKVSAQFVLYGEPDLIRKVFDGMHGRHISMAVEMGSVVRLENCGGGEGYAPTDMADKIGKKLRDLGETLDYVALDEPVWFGHEVTKGMTELHQSYCAHPLKVVAQRAGITAHAMRKYFPDVKIGVVDVISTALVPANQLAQDYGEFARLLQQEIGGRLAFFHCDIAWHTDWRAALPRVKWEMQKLAIPFGIIIGGSPEHQTEEEWVDAALTRLRTINADPSMRPDQIVAQSWQDFPTHMLPETQAGTETYLLLQAERLSKH